MDIKNKHTNEAFGIIVDKTLDKYSGQILFPEKVAKAKDMLKDVELPKKKAKA